MLDRPEYRLEFLEPGNADESHPEQRPSYLLDPQWQVVPYRHRPDPEERLTAWRDQPGAAVSVLLVHGPGGQGKTRLASRFASQAHQDGWAVAQAVQRSPRLRPGHPMPSPLRTGQPLLVVVDYADRWPLPILAQMVDNLPYDYPKRTIRVLLLARPLAGLWRDVSATLNHGTIDLAEPEQLGDFTDDPAGREDAYAEAVAAFANRMGMATVELPSRTDLDDEAYRSPLTLHMAALSAVCAHRDGQPAPTRQRLSDYLLAHETRYWQSVATGLTVDAIERVVFVSTLFGPVTGLGPACALLRRARLADGDAHARAVIDAHDRLYPTHDESALPPLRPDRFGEDFLARHLKDHPRATASLAELLADAPNGTTPDTLSVRRCLSMLAATAARHTEARPVLFGVLTGQPTLATLATADVLRVIIDHAPDDVAAIVDAALPRYSSDLLRPARDLAQRLLDALPADASPTRRATRLTRLGIRLAEVGDTRAAVEPTREATGIYRALAEAEPAAYLPDLAMSLNNLGIRLAEVGDKRAALEPTREATGIYRALAEAAAAAYLPDLAASLNNLGVYLSQVGDTRAALEPTREAVTIRRALAEAEPAAYLPDLAMALNN
ncbi:MAG TPA: tetratricopeptide repeat protein, partial [Mycobacteriales bacterium]|nr:tetratricopeptide repeat protein [Mycobacteriales bacterium]